MLSLLILFSCSTENTNYNTVAVCGTAPEVFVSTTEGGKRIIEIGLSSDVGLRRASPSFAIWAEYPDGIYQSIYATCKSAKNAWDGPGIPSETLPIWNGVRKTEGLLSEGDQIDAITTATPTKPEFKIQWSPQDILVTDTLNVYIEANLASDYNEYYQSSGGPNGQPSILYRIQFSQDNDSLRLVENPRIIGHGHPKGLDNKIYFDRTGLTTALTIFKKITAR